MTKARTQGQRRRGRPRLPPDVPRETNGQRQRPRTSERDTQRLVIEARCARLGVEYHPDMASTIKQPWYGCQAGRAIADERDVGQLWGVISAIRQRRARYLATAGLPADHPRTPPLPIPDDETEPFGEPPRYDPRDETEQARDAAIAWGDVETACNAIHPLVLNEVMLSVIWEYREPTNDLAAVLRRVGKNLGVM